MSANRKTGLGLILLALGFGALSSPATDVVNYVLVPALCATAVWLLVNGALLAQVFLAPLLTIAVQVVSRIGWLLATPPSDWGFFLFFGILPSAGLCLLLSLALGLFGKLRRF